MFVCDLRIASDNALDTSQVTEFSLTVTKCTADRETSWEYTVWAHEWIFFVVTVLRLRTDILPDLLRLCRGETILHDGLCLIDVTTSIVDALELFRARRLVIVRKLSYVRCRLHLHLWSALQLFS